ncbi:MAG: hypothetical protein M1834_005095 [Cirrosporium novae-zelandiae]|nr:MAG: hypothetical protein M1834_005095 [Cirrosporium novae-zelandiae]
MSKAITISLIDGKPGKPGKVYYPIKLQTVPIPTPKQNELLIKVSAAALNHRDLFIRQHLYPAISFETPLLADGCGVVISPNSKYSPQRVILNPGTGWDSDPLGPEKQAYFILGGTSSNPLGTLQETLAIADSEVELAPEHLSDVEAAALPLTGLTAWRAFNTKSGNAEVGRNILVTGIGGGVAIMVLLFAAAKGCNVFVTSSSEEKIARAKELGAVGGVNYKDKEWGKNLQKMLPKDRPFLDAVIDGAGGDIVPRTWKVLKHGGVIVSYGMTVMPQLAFTMQAVMKNIDIRGSTMGSREEFREMVEYVRQKKIKPIVDRVVVGIDNVKEIDGLFEDMKKGNQFGKLVIQICKSEEGEGSKL